MCKSDSQVTTQQDRNNNKKGRYTWQEVSEHNKKDDKWLVIDNEVYDITRWSLRHPGGSKVISHYAGQDATEAFRAFHKNLAEVKKYMKVTHIGSLQDTDAYENIKNDLEDLRQTAIKMDLFTPKRSFFLLHIGHILALELLSILIIYYYGTGWIPWLLAIACYGTAQVQGGYAGHDYGHNSISDNTRINNHIFRILMCLIKGAGADWWKHMHNQHHAKPNVLNKDPDTRLDALIVVGDSMAKRVAKRGKNSVFFNLPFNFQHRFFFFSLPPLLFPTYFLFMVFYHTITRRKWQDLFWMIIHWSKVVFFHYALFGSAWLVFTYNFWVRVLESSWFVWVTQSNHVPMEVDYDKDRPWLQQQLAATCNVEHTAFNDWFTGHLNYQIEHHLFPTMPRHNYYKIKPLVESLCKKHGLNYQVKSLYTAFADIIRTLEKSGQLWEHYYEAYHM